MANSRKSETDNQHYKELNKILYKFVDDEMDYDISDNEIMETIRQYINASIEKVKKDREQHEEELGL